MPEPIEDPDFFNPVIAKGYTRSSPHHERREALLRRKPADLPLVKFCILSRTNKAESIIYFRVVVFVDGFAPNTGWADSAVTEEAIRLAVYAVFDELADELYVSLKSSRT